jgi:Domain of Unknown Function with PDB structure (DUF3857)/Protein of unknown function (DUF2569)
MFEKPQSSDVPRILLLIFSLFTGLSLTAGNLINIKPAPSWILPNIVDGTRSPGAKNISGGYYYDLMDRQVNLEKQSVYVHIIRHIVNESGVQEASEVSVSFSPQFQQVAFHKVAVIRNGHIINQLVSSSIKTADEESEAPSYLYNGTRRAYIILKNIQKGDLIDISYSIIGFNPVFNGMYSGETYFYNNTAVSNYYLSYIAASDRKLNFKLFNAAVAPTQQSAGSQIIYQWKNPPIENSSSSSDIPTWYTNSPYVSVSEFKDWKQVNDWGLLIFNNYQYKLPAKLLEKMAAWKKVSSGDPDMFANLALRYVQNQIRYLGLEIGSNSHQPHAPEMVFDQGFGDCKDKALLLAVILKHENIDAYVAFTNSQEKENLSQAAPSALAFDHAIVALRRGNNFVFIDPTRSLQRGELINNYIPAFGWALVVQPGGNSLSQVEPGYLNYTFAVEDLTVSLDDTSFLKVTTDYKGGAADGMRNDLSESSLKEMQENYLSYYNKLFEGAETDSAISIEDDSLKNAIKILESYKIPKIWEINKDGKKEVFTYAKLISSKFPDPTDHKSKDPVALDFPCTSEYTLRMTMPENWSVNMEEVHIKNASFQFDFTPSGYDNHLLFKYYFKSFRDYIPAEDFAQYKADYKEIAGSLSLSFTSSDITTPPSKQKNFEPEGNTNWITLWITLLAGLLFIMLFNFLNRRSLADEDLAENAMPIQGAVILLAITLGIRFLYQGYVFIDQHYFRQTVWNQLGVAGGAGLQTLLVAEMCVALFSMAGSVALLYWFFKKRDIFPYLFIRFVVICLGAQFLLLVAYHTIKVPLDLAAVKNVAGIQLIRSLVYAGIWISYIATSENVKRIFVCPYD